MMKAKVCDKSKVKSKVEPRRVGARIMSGGSSKKQISVLNTGCCCECGELISKETKALQCERCVIETCLGISDDLYYELISSSKNCLHWFCPKCEEVV